MYITTHNHRGSKSISLKVDLNVSTNLLVIHNWGVSKANPWCKIYVYQIKTITATTTTTTIIITTATTTIKVNVLSCHTLSCAIMCRPIPILKIPTIEIPSDTEILPTGTIQIPKAPNQNTNLKFITPTISTNFLLDPGIPGVRSMGPGVSLTHWLMTIFVTWHWTAFLQCLWQRRAAGILWFVNMLQTCIVSNSCVEQGD